MSGNIATNRPGNNGVSATENGALNIAPVFIYHGFFRRSADLREADPDEHRYFLSVNQFQGQLNYLAGHPFRVCSVEEYLSAPPQPGTKRVVLTFDDGHVSQHDWAWPMLRERGFQATFFIVAAWVDQPGRISRTQLREMVRAGMSVGSHGLTHARLSELSLSELDRELVESKQRLEQMLEMPVRHLAVPGGFVNSRVLERAALAGYECVCTSEPGLGRPGNLLPRLSLTRLTSLKSFRALAERSRFALARRQAAYLALRGAKRFLGLNSYDALCRKLFVSGPRDESAAKVRSGISL